MIPWESKASSPLWPVCPIGLERNELDLFQQDSSSGTTIEIEMVMDGKPKPGLWINKKKGTTFFQGIHDLGLLGVLLDKKYGLGDIFDEHHVEVTIYGASAFSDRGATLIGYRILAAWDSSFPNFWPYSSAGWYETYLNQRGWDYAKDSLALPGTGWIELPLQDLGPAARQLAEHRLDFTYELWIHCDGTQLYLIAGEVLWTGVTFSYAVQLDDGVVWPHPARIGIFTAPAVLERFLTEAELDANEPLRVAFHEGVLFFTAGKSTWRVPTLTPIQSSSKPLDN